MGPVKFNNALPQKLIAALFCTVGTIIVFLISLILNLTFEKKQGDALYMSVIVFGSILLIIWFIFFLVAFIFHKTIVVNDDIIVLKRGKKVVWTIKKEDIIECTYSKIFCKGKFYPEAGVCHFKLKSTNDWATRKICSDLFYIENTVGLSFGNIKKLINLGYVVKIINLN